MVFAKIYFCFCLRRLTFDWFAINFFSLVLITVAFDDICFLLQEKGCAIVYCRTRDDCVVLSDKISNRGIAARPYHAGRRLNQTQLRANGNLLIRGIPS